MIFIPLDTKTLGQSFFSSRNLSLGPAAGLWGRWGAHTWLSTKSQGKKPLEVLPVGKDHLRQHVQSPAVGQMLSNTF